MDRKRINEMKSLKNTRSEILRLNGKSNSLRVLITGSVYKEINKIIDRLYIKCDLTAFKYAYYSNKCQNYELEYYIN